MLRDKLEFVAVLQRELPEQSVYSVVSLAQKLMRLGATHCRLCTQWCNGPWDDKDEKRLDRVRERIELTLNGTGIKAACGGDPRGATVKLTFPSKVSNSFAGDGYCVPQS